MNRPILCLIWLQNFSWSGVPTDFVSKTSIIFSIFLSYPTCVVQMNELLFTCGYLERKDIHYFLAWAKRKSRKWHQLSTSHFPLFWPLGRRHTWIGDSSIWRLLAPRFLTPPGSVLRTWVSPPHVWESRGWAWLGASAEERLPWQTPAARGPFPPWPCSLGHHTRISFLLPTSSKFITRTISITGAEVS